METDINSIPDKIFDWLHQYAFYDLDAAKQAEVLLYFSADAYNDMHEAISEVQLAGGKQFSCRKQTIKQNLLSEFDKTLQKPLKKKSLLLYPVALWKVAATLLFFASAGLYLAQKDTPIAANNALAQADTVYITQQVAMAPVKVYDTVYIAAKPRSENIATKLQSPHDNRQSSSNTSVAMPNLPEHVVSINELNNNANLQKNNSMKDDSLERNFTFVTL